MRNQGLVLIAILIILAGIFLLIDNLFDINLGAFCWPIGLILLGVFVLLRPRMVGPDTNSHVVLIGDVERAGAWELTNEEYWGLIIDAGYDLTKADIPPGETVIRGFSFIGDVEIYAPADLALAVDASSLITSLKLDGQEEEEAFLSPIHWRTDGYKMAERRVRFELNQFIGDVKVRRF
jgi:predicted membrane protein